MSESANDMPSTSVAQTSPPRLPTQERPRRPQVVKIGVKLKTAIDLVVFEGLPLNEAAAKSQMTTFQLRQAFARPHVIAHLKARREVLRSSLCGSNILRLGQIRDAADNMPAIQAIRTLGQMSEDQPAGGSAASHSPGITIRIINQAPQQATQVNIGHMTVTQHE